MQITHPDDRSTLVHALETLAPFREEIERQPRATLRPHVITADDAGRRAIEALMAATQRERTVTLGDTLGQGGMGVVHLAEQVALGRTVAVKRLRPDHRSDKAVLALMREAWVTGALEHPNIVPVHDVGLDANGLPFLVMKRIEGEHWGALIAAPGVVRSRFAVEDVQAWHLGVLQQICHAVAFAHARGVIHRDLKPENVMVGAFGEVYLLDWGIAVRLEPEPSGRFPVLRPDAVAGTPAYMAPEMLGRGAVGPWSDVYLLGGLLYEVLTGRPPHEGADLSTLLSAIHDSRPRVPEGPEELVALCVEALDPDPARRPESAEAFRQRLARHIERRGVLRLVAQADQALDQLQAGLVVSTPDQQALWRWFGEARFGFRQALVAWPEHGRAREGLSRAVTAMARFELSRGDPHGAARLLGEDDVQDLALLDAARSEIASRDRAARDSDPALGQRTRWFVATVMALTWSAVPTGVWLWGSLRGHTAVLAMDVGFVIAVLALGVWARESLTKTWINRQTWLVLLMAPAGQIVLTLGMILLGLSPEVFAVLQLFFWFTLGAMVTISLELRMWPVTVGYLVGWLAAARWPELALPIAAASNLVLAVTVSALWFPGRRAVPAAG